MDQPFMDTTQSIDLVWWIGMVELPVITALFLLIWRIRRELMDTLEALRRQADDADQGLAADLAAFKLEVAKQYASNETVREVERRLTAHLLRIEQKIDGQPLLRRTHGDRD
jgi:hypothetical protein